MTGRKIKIAGAQVAIQFKNADFLQDLDVLVLTTKNQNVIQGIISLEKERKVQMNLIPGAHYVGLAYVDDADFTVDNACFEFIVTAGCEKIQSRFRKEESCLFFS